MAYFRIRLKMRGELIGEGLDEADVRQRVMDVIMQRGEGVRVTGPSGNMLTAYFEAVTPGEPTEAIEITPYP